RSYSKVLRKTATMTSNLRRCIVCIVVC
ncbi:cation efflux system domain protein, partial [Vibrio parahaemolyticus V-223/04]